MRPSAILQQGDRRALAAGTCWVMQWMLPPPSRISRPGTPTTLRSGKMRFRRDSASGIGARIQQWHHDAAIGDVEIRVRRLPAVHRPAAASRLRGMLHACGFGRGHAQWTGRRQLVHLEPPAARIRRRLQPFQRIVRYTPLRIAPVGRKCQADFTGPRETGEVVDVAIGLVVDHAFAQPDDGLTPV